MGSNIMLGIDKTIQRATSLALAHWSYVHDVIEKHGEPDKHGFYNTLSEYQIAYMAGFIAGYIDKEIPGKYYYSTGHGGNTHSDSQKIADFHYRSAYDHGQKHREQDDAKSCNN